MLIDIGDGNKGEIFREKKLDTWAVSSSCMVIFSELVLIDLVKSRNRGISRVRNPYIHPIAHL